MSKNTNIADLINYISVDGSGNVVLTTGGQVATQSYVTTAVSNLVNSAPSTLDTLNELAAALGNDSNFATTVTNSIATKLPLSGGTLTGALSGTSATFTSNVNVGTNIAQLLPITTTNFQILTGCYYDGSNIIATATSGTRIISNAGSFTFNNFTGATIGGSVSDIARLTISSTGAATFSGGVIGVQGTNQNYIRLSPSAGGAGFSIGRSLSDNNAQDFFIYDGIANATRLFINSSGNVGIGTSSPVSTLDVSSTSPTITIRNSSQKNWNTGDQIGYLDQYIDDSSSAGARVVSFVRSIVSNGVSSGVTVASDLIFGTANYDATAREVMRINNSGNVGIGTSSPSYKLHVYNTAATDVAMFESTQVFSTLAFKSSTNSSSATIGIDGAGNAAFENKLSSSAMTFVTNGSERMRISNVGSVSIGMTSSYYGNVAIKSNGATSYFGLNVYANSNNSFIALNHTGSVGIIETEFASGGAHAPMAFVTGGSERMRITSDGVTQVSNLRTTNLYNEYTKNLSGAYSAGTYYEIVNSSQMTSGIYIIMAYVDTYAIGGGTYFCTYVSVPFFFYTQGTNNGGTVTLPPMIGSGHANMNPPTIRIRLSSGSTGGLTYVEFDPNANWSNVQGVGGATVVFYLKRIGN